MLKCTFRVKIEGAEVMKVCECFRSSGGNLQLHAQSELLVQ